MGAEGGEQSLQAGETSIIGEQRTCGTGELAGAGPVDVGQRDRESDGDFASLETLRLGRQRPGAFESSPGDADTPQTE